MRVGAFVQFMSQPDSADGRRDTRIDSLRGLACIMLVAYHVVGLDNSGGLEIGDGTLRTLNDALGIVRMPLFTFVSGFVYALRPFTGDATPFLLAKVRRLLLPMLIIGTVFLLVQSYAPGHHAQPPDWKTVHLIPVAHYWFVEALFLIFLTIVPLESLGVLRTRGGVLACWLAAVLLNSLSIDIAWFGINGAIYLMPFFLLGLACRRFVPLSQEQRSPLIAAMVLLAIVAIALCFWVTVHVSASSNWSVGELLLSSLSCLLLLWSRLRSETLAWIGGFSYTIYLLHVFFTAAMRIALHSMHVGYLPVHLAAGVAAGIFLPIGMDKLLSRNPITRVAILGRR